jgi:hypothetical protein
VLIEQALVVLALIILSPSKDEIFKLLKVIVWTAFSLFILGIIESLTSIRLFDAFYTVQRPIINEYYIRLGLLRSVTTMGMPGIYSNMCILILPLALYLFNITLQKRYLLICFADILAGIHSGSRSYVFYLCIVYIFYLAYVLRKKTDRYRCLKNSLTLFLLLFIITALLSIANPVYRYFYTGSAKAIFNEFGADFDLNADAPEGVEGYGRNYDSTYLYKGGVSSRKLQLSGIVYTLIKKPIYGLGQGAIERDEIMYYSDHWSPYNAIDVGLVEIVMYEGILGLLAYLSLFLFIVLSLTIRSMSHIQKSIGILLIICYILSTLSTCNMMNFLVLITYGSIVITKLYPTANCSISMK